MALLKLREFGGILPSVQKRRLPDDAAQTAHNLDLRFGDFRPLRGQGEPVATVASGTQSIFRTPSGVWLSSTSDVNYVNGQINDAASERVYLTGRSAYPEAWQSAAYRRLGVPRPTTAPAVTVNVVDEFSRDELNTSTPQIIDAIEDSVRNNLSALRIGDAPVPIVPPTGGGDGKYGATRLHIKADGTPGTQVFADSSIRNVTIAPGAAVIQATSWLTGGGQVARFNGGEGLSFGLIRAESFQDWAVEFYYESDAGATQLKAQAYGGYITLFDATGAYTLFSRLDRNTNDRTVITANATFPANTPRKVQLLNSGGSGLELYIDGVLMGTGAAQGLELSGIGWTRNNFGGYRGEIDEFRVTVGATRSASATFEVFTTGPGVGGFWLEHGVATTPALPTTGQGQWAYLVPLVVEGGSYVIANFADRYLQSSTFGGRQVTYLSVEYWAVPSGYQALGQVLNEMGMSSALQLIPNPSGGGFLIPATVADTISTSYGDLLRLSLEPLLSMVARIDAAQDTLTIQLASSDLGAAKASTVLVAFADLNAATAAVTAYFAAFLANLELTATSTFESFIRSLLPTPVVREVETRAYVYTYVTDWGEESAPSPASELASLDQNDTATVVPAAAPSGRFVVGWRLYRSSTTDVSQGFQLVAKMDAPGVVLDGPDFDYYPIGTLTLTDDQAQAELQETLLTVTWAEPPATMIGLVGLPNGIMAGFYGKTVCLSEPFAPYAWPVEYQATVEHDIVGLGVFGQTLVVLTEGHPYYGSGADSANFSLQKLESTQACAAKRTIAGMEGGVVFASPDGLCIASAQGVQLLTGSAFERADWQALLPHQCGGGFHEGIYYLFPDGSMGLHTDLLTDTLYAATGVDVTPMFRGSALTGEARTKVIVRNDHPGFGWLRVNADDFGAGITVRVYGDGVLHYTSPALLTRDPVRMPPGRYREWEIDVRATVKVDDVTLAGSASELEAA